jgi:hypothetical protein
MSAKEFGRDGAEKLLRAAGITKRHPDYKFFHVVTMSVFETATKRTRQFQSIAEALRKATAGDNVDLELIRRVIQYCEGISLRPDLNALRGILVGVRARVARQKSESNLRAAKSVTDAQVRAAIKGRTRAEAAVRLGITERQLYRRLENMTSDRMS